MDRILQSIPRKSYNNYGNGVILLFFLCGIIIIPIASDFDAKTTIECNPPKEITSSHGYIQSKCFAKYEAKYHWKISFSMLVLINFAIVLILSFLYASWAKPRIDNWDISAQRRDMADGTFEKSGISLFLIYVSHLLFTRFLLLFLFALIIFYPTNFPTNFTCVWNSHNQPEKTIPCMNSMGRKKTNLAKAVATINIIFAFLSLAEVIYIFFWKERNDEFSLTDDMEFSSVYILQRRKDIGSIIGKIKNSTKVGKNFFIKLITQEDKPKDEIDDIHRRKPKEKINNIGDIFEAKDESGSLPRRILIVGRPGVGKTELTKRILQEWNEKKAQPLRGKLVLRLPFRTFKLDENRELNLRTLLSHADGINFEPTEQTMQDLYQFIERNQSKVIIVFDGLHELDVDLENCWEDEATTLNNAELKMCASSLYIKLIQGHFLPQATIITTTRRTAEKLYNSESLKTNFDKRLEILGFTKQEIEDFVKNFCKKNEELRTKIWNMIEKSAELLSICYIPAICNIVCTTLKESIESENHKRLTMTEIYQRYTRIVLFDHHRSRWTKRKKKPFTFEDDLPSELETDIKNLAKIAKSKLEMEELEFELDEELLHLEHCGLLMKVRDKSSNRFSFAHRTIQEYFAAVHIFNDHDMSEFLLKNMKVNKWHLVIKFLAGLIGKELRRLREKASPTNNLSKMTKYKLENIVFNRLVPWIISLSASEDEEKNIALLAVKCLHEIQNTDIIKKAAKNLERQRNHALNLCKSHIAPMDCRGLFHFLTYVQNLKILNLAENQISDLGVLELCKLLKANHSLCELDISNNSISNVGIEALCGALTEDGSVLYHLNVSANEFTDAGVEILCEALKHENCQLTYLNLSQLFELVTRKSQKYICDALKHENCKLTYLTFRWEDLQDLDDMLEALQHENCKLTTLNLGYISTFFPGAKKKLQQASHVDGFQAI